ncbi:hypothetical protein L9F63_024032 [Diploptera punctata]|uniref:Uncharacterized protein n=1 Tax=Diploptera punctata TaxID=6984 RepID=A0AAD7ZHW1_DIPPU|nr:hypothetical protein L9F63_024032 [Diploptera punctata]
MNTTMIAFFGLLLTAVVFSMPVEESEKLQTVILPESEEPSTLEPPQMNEIDYEDPDEPLFPDDDDMEVAEVLVFRPMYSYRRVQEARRRKARRNQNRRNVGYRYV